MNLDFYGKISNKHCSTFLELCPPQIRGLWSDKSWRPTPMGQPSGVIYYMDYVYERTEENEIHATSDKGVK